MYYIQIFKIKYCKNTLNAMICFRFFPICFLFEMLSTFYSFNEIKKKKSDGDLELTKIDNPTMSYISGQNIAVCPYERVKGKEHRSSLFAERSFSWIRLGVGGRDCTMVHSTFIWKLFGKTNNYRRLCQLLHCILPQLLYETARKVGGWVQYKWLSCVAWNAFTYQCAFWWAPRVTMKCK